MAAEQSSLQPLATTEDTRNRPARTVLLAIPSDALRAQVRRFLAHLGFGVREVPTPERALAALPHASFDLLVAEDRNGYGFVRQVLAECRGLRILVISSEPEEISRELICEPAVAFLEKPFAWCELARKLEDFLSAPPESRAECLCA